MNYLKFSNFLTARFVYQILSLPLQTNDEVVIDLYSGFYSPTVVKYCTL